ncbi:MAG: ribonuclease E/G [Defluviitaleaceae bacterium]|nr:ribonuclease E/G [Defluviitaleaceae bacterium]
MKRLFIDRQPDCVRIAYTVDGKLREIYIDPIGSESLVGHVYVGCIQNILPGQFAFVDIGTAKNAFINLPRNHTVKKGQPILMQVYKDAYRTKGPYGGQALKLKGRNVIIRESPRGEIGVSHKIGSASERSRLRSAVRSVLEKGFGAIVRTHADGQPEENLAEETTRLIALHRTIEERAKYALPPTRIHPKKIAELPEELLVEMLTDDLDEIWVHEADYEHIKAICPQSACNLKDILFIHNNSDLFDIHNISRQMERALEKTVWLPCGGYITFEQTEACVVVDVNTGAFTGGLDFRAAVLQTNVEAAAAIAEQLTLRNLSGIIIVDFIDMKDIADKTVLMRVLAAELKEDRIKTEIIGMTELGLVQLTRRKTRPSLSRMLETDCAYCEGSGRTALPREHVPKT